MVFKNRGAQQQQQHTRTHTHSHTHTHTLTPPHTHTPSLLHSFTPSLLHPFTPSLTHIGQGRIRVTCGTPKDGAPEPFAGTINALHAVLVSAHAIPKGKAGKQCALPFACRRKETAQGVAKKTCSSTPSHACITFDRRRNRSARQRPQRRLQRKQRRPQSRLQRRQGRRAKTRSEKAPGSSSPPLHAQAPPRCSGTALID